MKIVFCIPSTTKNRDNNKQLEIILSLSKIKDYKNKPDIYVGYDSDDPIYNNKENRDNIYPELNIKWYSQNVEKGNVVKIWNNLTEQAIKDGYEYIMLIGDDIIYPDNDDWIKKFCESLKNNNMYGISAGDSGNPNLPMTQFMITNKHYELFGYAFNPQLKNWFCDNYLGGLYPKEYINYFEEVKLWNAGGKPRYIPENHQELCKKLLIEDKSKLDKILNEIVYLSICIPTLVERLDKVSMLINKIQKQIDQYNLKKYIQIISHLDNRSVPLYKKRNNLQKCCSGKYFIHMDDDDDLSEDYIITMYNTIKNLDNEVDIITYNQIAHVENDTFYVVNDLNCDFNLKYIGNKDNKKVFVRFPWQWCAWNTKRFAHIYRSDIDTITGEDTNWLRRIMLEYPTTQFNIPKVLHQYNFQDPSLSACTGLNKHNISDNKIPDNKIKPIHFITYGDSNFEKSKQRILTEAKEFDVFKSIKGYGPQDLPDDFIVKYKDIFKHSRGGGYWIWRPNIIRQAINDINDGEYLVYLDAGCTINKKGKKRFYEYIDKLENSQNNYGILSFQMSGNISDFQKEKWWSTSQIFEYFNIKPDSDIGESGQYLGGIFILKKNKHLLEYLDKYEKCIYENPYLITDIYNDKDQHEDFKENRHEQSMTSILRKIHGSEVIDGDESWIIPFGGEESLKYPFWATRIKG
jgi:hypothetical protein